MHKKQVIINMVANMLAFFVQFGVSFFLTPYLINSLGRVAYGFVPLANNIIGYVNIITIALNSMAARFISIEMNQGNKEKANVYFNSVLVANTVLAVILSIPSVLFVLFINKVIDVPGELLVDVQMTFAFALLGMVISLMLSVYGVTFFIRNRMDLSARRNIEGNIIRAVVLVALFSLLKPKIYYITATMLLVTIYMCVANFYYTKKLTPELRMDTKKFSKNAVKTLLSSGIWNSVNQLSVVLLTTLDLFLANLLAGADASGEYAIVKTIPNLIQSIVSTLVGVFVPQFTILYAKNKQKDLLESVGFSVKMMGLLITIPIGFLIVFGQDFFHIWVPTQDAQKLHMLSLLTIIPMIITGSVNTVFNVYTVTNKLKIPALVWLAFGILNVFLVVLLMVFTDLGIWAIPIVAFALGLLRNLTFTPIYASKCLHVKWNTFYMSIMRGCACAVTMIFVCCLYKTIMGGSTSWPELIIAAFICAIITLSINLFIVLKKSERRRILGMVKTKLHI